MFIIAGVVFCPQYIRADTPKDDDSFERGYERGREFERGYQMGRHEREGRNRVIASGHGVSLGSSRYSFRDWDEDWGFSVSLIPWDQRIVGDTDSKKPESVSTDYVLDGSLCKVLSRKLSMSRYIRGPFRERWAFRWKEMLILLKALGELTIR